MPRWRRTIPDLAKRWLDRAQGKLNDSPQVSRERERYLTLKGDLRRRGEAGRVCDCKLPHDREGAVYLAYDLYYLGRLRRSISAG